ncbi:neural cell adhesion molecule 2-like isoform X2 [Mytilus californianus]|uniref:neural cell adhesion molecule 2-like isoform X2 n=1 Tax=Mytilus californianus TaxID=6549 RepID=UPI00224641D0|nr:neural cell adhesion molecule 2-like isoform X2 [Mytilus californianus]
MCVLMFMLLVLSDFSAAYSSSHLLVKQNSSIVITCPFKVKSLPIVWLGPGEDKLTTYSVGTLISRNISAYSRIRLIGNHSNGEYNLNILNVSMDDVGTYQCQSVQNGTAVQRTFILNILEKPKTLSNIRFFKFETKIGIPTNIAVKVKSLQVPTISWTQNIGGGRLGVWTATANGSNIFLLRSTVVEHFGQHRIKVRNDAGSIDLTIKLLLIEYPVTVQPSNAYCSASTRVNLVCQFATEDAKGWQTYWTHNRNGNFIKTLPGFINGNKSTLQISFCDYREEGDYICKWKTQFKEYSASSFVRANGPPRITDTGHWWEKQNIWMTVDFYSVQEYIVHWFKTDNALAVSRRIRISISSSIVKLNYTNKMIKEDGFKSKLCISNFSSNDITSYSCQVVNIYGSVEYTFEDYLLNNTFNQYAYGGQSTEMYTTQQDIIDMKAAFTNVGIPLKFVLIGICLVIVVITVAIASFWYNNQRNILKDSTSKTRMSMSMRT